LKKNSQNCLSILRKVRQLLESQILISRRIRIITKTFIIKRQAVSVNSNIRCINNSCIGNMQLLQPTILIFNNRDTSTTTTKITIIIMEIIMETTTIWEEDKEEMAINITITEIKILTTPINLTIKSSSLVMNNPITCLWKSASRLWPFKTKNKQRQKELPTRKELVMKMKTNNKFNSSRLMNTSRDLSSESFLILFKICWNLKKFNWYYFFNIMY